MSSYSDTPTRIRFYKDETTCKCCGRYIRNVVEIDGVEYGTTCCEKFMPRGAGINPSKTELSISQQAIDRARKTLDSLDKGRYDRFCSMAWFDAENFNRIFSRWTEQGHDAAELDAMRLIAWRTAEKRARASA